MKLAAIQCDLDAERLVASDLKIQLDACNTSNDESKGEPTDEDVERNEKIQQRIQVYFNVMTLLSSLPLHVLISVIPCNVVP